MTKKRQRILVYDDNGQFREQLLETVKRGSSGFQVEAVGDDNFKTAMEVLLRRAGERRSGRELPSSQSLFDKCDILIVDFDLLGSQAGEFLTGDEVAYLARCYSQCGIIVAVNRPPRLDFDLTLRGHLDSYADLNVQDQHLANKRLWGGRVTGFAPWQWFNLPRAIEDYRRRVADVATHVEKPILEFLEFPPSVSSILPKEMVEFLGDSPAKVTFRQFAKSSGNALRHHDAKHADDETISRVCAARLSTWLEQVVLPSQSILVDAPHLISRFPSLLKSNGKKIGEWNSLPSLTNDSDCKILSDAAAGYRFPKRHWLSRPAWFWPTLSKDEDIFEVREPWSGKQPPYGFCEDASRFHPMKECDPFLADVPSSFSHRYIRKSREDDIHYGPEVRLTM